jgi:hypothetical protein
MSFCTIFYEEVFVSNLSCVTLAMLYFGCADFGCATTAIAAQRTSASLISAPLNHRSITYFDSAQSSVLRLSITLRRIQLSRNITQVFGSGLKQMSYKMRASIKNALIRVTNAINTFCQIHVGCEHQLLIVSFSYLLHQVERSFGTNTNHWPKDRRKNLFRPTHIR